MRVSALSWGLVFIGCGIFWLAINAGYLDHYVWIKLLSLWPMALIAVGIILIFKRTRLKFLTLLAPLLLALTFVYVGASEWGGSHGYYYRSTHDYDSKYSREVFQYTLEKDPEVEKLDFSMDFGLGELWIGGTSDKLFDGDFEYRSKKPRIDYNVVRGEGKLRIESRDTRGFNIFRHRDIKNDSRVFIADYLPLALDLDVGAARVDLDLSDQILHSLKLSTGAAEINLRLGCKAEKTQIDIDAGASDIYITVPRELALEIDSDATLSKTNFKSAGLTREGGKYRTDNFGTASCTVYLNLDSGVSKITVGYY